MQIELRNYHPSDILALATLANNKNVSMYLRDIFPYPYLESDAMSFIDRVLQLPPQQGIEFAITVDQHFAGAIGVTFDQDVYRHTCEIGYWLGEPFWGHGIISKAIAMIIPYIFTYFDIHKIFAEVFSENIGSQKALEKNGFVKEGILKNHVYKNGQFHDIIIYGLCREPL